MKMKNAREPPINVEIYIYTGTSRKFCRKCLKKRGNDYMVYDLTFEEAMDVLKSRLGWVQGEKFDEHEYLALDRRRDIFIKNVVDDSQFGCVFDFYGDQTREVWGNINSMPEEMKTQKYRFILVLNRDSVKGVGAFSKGNNRDSYLRYKSLNRP